MRALWLHSIVPYCWHNYGTIVQHDRERQNLGGLETFHSFVWSYDKAATSVHRSNFVIRTVMVFQNYPCVLCISLRCFTYLMAVLLPVRSSIPRNHFNYFYVSSYLGKPVLTLVEENFFHFYLQRWNTLAVGDSLLSIRDSHCISLISIARILVCKSWF